MTDTQTVGNPEPFRVGHLGRHSLIYAVGLVATKAVAFVMLPIYARLLTPADYGVIQLIVMTIEMVTILAASRLAWGVFHYYHKAEPGRPRNEVLSTAALLVAASYGLVSLLTFVAAPAIGAFVFGVRGAYDTLVRIAAVSLAFEGLFVVPTAVYQLQDRSRLFVAVSLLKLVLSVALNLVFLIPFQMGVAGVLLSSMVTNVALGSVLMGRLLRDMGFAFRMQPARDLLRFGLPLIVMQVATFVLTFGDRYFLNRAGDTAAVGLYGLAYQFGFLVATIGFMPFQRVWDPQRFAVAKRPDRDAIYARVFIYLNLLLVSAGLGVSMFAGDVLRLIATPPFHPAAAFVPMLAAAYVFQCWGTFLNLGIFIREKTEYFTIANWIAAGVALAGYVFLIPRWLAWGAAFATLASLGTRALVAHAISQRLWRIEYRWGPVRVLAGLALAVGLVSTALPALPVLASVAVHTGLFAAYVGLAWLAPILSAEERRMVVDRLGRILRRFPASA